MVMWWCGIGLIAAGGILFWLGLRRVPRPVRGTVGGPSVAGATLRIGGATLFLVGAALLFLGNTLAS